MLQPVDMSMCAPVHTCFPQPCRPHCQTAPPPTLPPALQRGRPFAVGGIGMISTASYAARKFGVRRWVAAAGAGDQAPHLWCR